MMVLSMLKMMMMMMNLKMIFVEQKKKRITCIFGGQASVLT